jgi:tetratricopeptide (TPR) repeat protein
VERKKYWIIIIIFIKLSAVASNSYKETVYNAFVYDEMAKWKNAVYEMENQKQDNEAFLLELISYQYGYAGWCLGNDKNNEAVEFLAMLENNLENLKNIKGETAEYHSFKAAAYGFKLGLNKWRAPFLGPKSMKHAEKAFEKDSLSMNANLEMGNIWNHMPEIFGGSKEKALNYYRKALNIFENKDNEMRHKNWLYLNLLVLIGQTENELGNEQKAIEYFEKTLQIEPDFLWVKEELLPSIKTD